MVGVKGLKSYITTFPRKKDIVEYINIREEVKRWSSEHDGKKPTIVIDLKELPRTLGLKDEHGIIIGGRYQKYNAMLAIWFKQLKSIEANFKFFSVGITKIYDTPEQFIIDFETKYMHYLTVLETIENGQDIRKYLNKKNKFMTDIRMTRPIRYNIEKMCQNSNYDIQFNHNLYNIEIAQYIAENADDVLAILTNNTEFLAFEGNYEYWSVDSLHLFNLNCQRFSKIKLNSYLELNPQQMHLLGALSAKIYRSEALKPFSAYLRVLYPKYTLIDCLAMFIKDQPMQSTDINPYGVAFDLKEICEKICKISDIDYDDNLFNIILGILKYYDFKSHNYPSNECSVFIEAVKKYDPFIYKLICEDEIYSMEDIQYIDYRNFKSKNYAELILPIFIKMCGILFKENHPQPKKRMFYMKFAHDEPTKLIERQIIYPSIDIPDLYKLIYERDNCDLDNIRWSLFGWILDFNDDMIQRIRDLNINNKFKITIITLTYLIEQGEITLDEANGFLLSEYQMTNDQISLNEMRKRIDYPLKLNVHYIRIAHLYTKIYILMNRCLEVCGLHKLTDIIRFDGANFHNQMNKIDGKNEAEKNEILADAKSIWTF